VGLSCCGHGIIPGRCALHNEAWFGPVKNVNFAFNGIPRFGMICDMAACFAMSIMGNNPIE